MKLKNTTVILLTFQLLFLLEARPLLEKDHEQSSDGVSAETTTEYCPWPPCYADSWNVDFAEIPLLNETKTQV